MKRLTYADLETLAWGKRRLIEIDEAAGIAVLTIGRNVYYADLPPVAAEGGARNG